MATPSTTANGHAKSTTREVTRETTDVALGFREQLVSTLQQGQKLSMDAAESFVKAVSVLPVSVLPGSVLPISDLPTIPGIPAMPNIEAAVRFYFDLAADVLSLQREFALQLTSALVPAKRL